MADKNLPLLAKLIERVNALTSAVAAVAKGEGPRGPQGEQGPRGLQGESIVGPKGDSIQGPRGETVVGPPGPAPAHKWNGTKLQFETPDGGWGEAVDLKGAPGKAGAGGGGGVSIGGTDIDDDTASANSTWSSAKISAMLQALNLPPAYLVPESLSSTFTEGVAKTVSLATVSAGSIASVAGVSPPLPEGLTASIVGGALQVAGTAAELSDSALHTIELRLSGGGTLTFALTLEVMVQLDDDVIAYAARVAAAGGTLTSKQTARLTRFAVNAKATGLWDKLLDVGIFADFNSAAVKLKSANGLDAVLNGFLPGDLTSDGLTSDGLKWVNTRVTTAQLSADGGTGSSGMGVFLTREVTQAGYGQIMGTDPGGNPQIALRWLGASDGHVDALLGGSGAATPQITKQRGKIPVGLLQMERTGADFRIYQGGLIAHSANSPISWVGGGGQVGVFAQGGGGNGIAMTIGMYFIDNGTLTDADAMIFSNLCNDLMVGLGRVVPDDRPASLVPIIGQSLALGSQGSPALSTTQPYKNLVIDSVNAGGNIETPVPGYWKDFGLGAQAGSLAPMVELSVETIASGAANTVSRLARNAGMGSTKDMLVYNGAKGATAYAGLKKGTNPYNNLLAVADVVKGPLKLYASGAFAIPAVWCVHGESDVLSGTYGADIRQWQVDYEADLKALTGQSGTIPIFHSQPSSFTSVNNANAATSLVPYQLLAEHEANPTKTVLVCPKYFLRHAEDGTHLIDTDYRTLGEYYGKAHFQLVVAGTPWSPLRPASISRTGAVIDVTFTGNVGTLVLDNTTVTDPSGNNTYGFEYSDSAGGDKYTRIASVAVLSADVIRVTLTDDPSANTGKTLRYAFTGTAGNSGGPTTGPRGCLRDSDTTVGQSGVALPNWCVHFSKAMA